MPLFASCQHDSYNAFKAFGTKLSRAIAIPSHHYSIVTNLLACINLHHSGQVVCIRQNEELSIFFQNVYNSTKDVEQLSPAIHFIVQI